MKLTIYISVTVLLFVVACAPQSQNITSFDECVAAGNPVMESYPRQCSANGQTFVEDITQQPNTIQMTTCPDNRPEFCTLEYNPVCALQTNEIQCITQPCPNFDAVTAGNACGACGMQNVIGHYPGTCEEQRFVVCQETITGFNITQIAQDAGWICVDVCPANYDVYTTQIGAQMCIQQYDEQDIAQWPTCTHSTNDCQCAKAYETTNNIPIQQAEYRCVPEQYAERMLFRAGLDVLDDDGNQGVMIA